MIKVPALMMADMNCPYAMNYYDDDDDDEIAYFTVHWKTRKLV